MIDFVSNRKILCLIDGEHYPPVTRAAMEEIEKMGGEIAGAVFIGGSEKVENASQLLGGENGYKLFHQGKQGEPVFQLIERAVDETKPDLVMDLSDEPVVDYSGRFRIGSLLMRRGVTYGGADFLFTPPPAEVVLKKPSISVIGTGKRIGKTAVGVFISRLLKREGFDPVVVCMGRGGPPNPEIVDPSRVELTPDTLIEVARGGGHAASDYWEDALLGQVVTVGCRRCGGGMVGSPFISNVVKGAEITNRLPQGFVIMEGSGATLPPVRTGANIVLVGAGQPVENVIKYYGEYRISISGMAIVTMCEPPVAGTEKVEMIRKGIMDINPDIKIALTVFRPEPLGSIEDRDVFVATTAPVSINSQLKRSLEEGHSCRVTGISNRLSNRPGLRKDLKEGLKDANLLLTEIKAASIDVAASMAKEAGMDIVFLNNRLELTGGNIHNLEEAVLDIAQSVRKGQ